VVPPLPWAMRFAPIRGRKRRHLNLRSVEVKYSFKLRSGNREIFVGKKRILSKKLFPLSPTPFHSL
ncbi:MAG: hypothetical protein JJU05_18710, partial [Verrucomicrobia bacterium]|nr:hypothetical protein [Verrucomicrobiota bacterium]